MLLDEGASVENLASKITHCAISSIEDILTGMKSQYGYPIWRMFCILLATADGFAQWQKLDRENCLMFQSGFIDAMCTVGYPCYQGKPSPDSRRWALRYLKLDKDIPTKVSWHISGQVSFCCHCGAWRVELALKLLNLHVTFGRNWDTTVPRRGGWEAKWDAFVRQNEGFPSLNMPCCQKLHTYEQANEAATQSVRPLSSWSWLMNNLLDCKPTVVVLPSHKKPCYCGSLAPGSMVHGWLNIG